MESIFLEIKAAEGGDDAKLLVTEMSNIYHKACNKQGFKISKKAAGLG
jgi:protein subunit release factor A